MALSPTAVADASRYFDSWLMFRRRVERTPGVQAAILLGDAVVLDTAHGLADVESATALRTSHLFRIASHSKTFTATAIMQLVEQGAVRLDDTIGAWVAFTSGTEIASVTIRELLAHGGGLVRDGADGDFWQLSRPFLDLEGLEAATEHGAAIVPRNERFKYSNIGYSLLGEVVATASGTPYNRYVVDNVVTRVGLTHTGPEYEPRRAGEYATGYSSLGYAERRLSIEHVDTAAMSSATGFYSTASDVVRYASAHFFGDDRLVSDDSKRIMQRTEWKVEGTDTSYGLGFAIATIGGRRLLGHGGGYPGHITRTYFDPVDRFAVSVLTNAIDGPATAMAMAAVRLVDLANSNSNSNSSARADGNVNLTRFRERFANL